MSTPTTATATLSHYHHPHHYPYSHHQSYQPNSTSSYRSTAANPVLPASSTAKVPPSYPATVGYSASTASNANTAVNGVNYSSSAASRPQHETSNSSSRSDANSSNTMPSSSHSQPDSQPARKRRRSREPDWNKFYKNGLPKEIIIIDDTPEPDDKVASTGPKTVVNSTTNGHANEPAARHVAKKRKRDEQYDPVYHSKYAGSHTNTPHDGTPSGSTISTDRTTSAVGTTAATSLSSNGQYEYDAQPGQKRKRTRQQIANEAKRREVEVLGGAYTSYQPPPFPPKKAAEVHVRVVPDVSSAPTSAVGDDANTNPKHHYNRNIKVDDDDGHYIVVPDADLTEKCTSTAFPHPSFTESVTNAAQIK
jgi:dual-specificity kinase